MRSRQMSRSESAIRCRGWILPACTIAASSPAWTHSCRKTELSSWRAAGESPKDKFAEEAAEDLVRKEERILPTSDPAGAIGGESAAGHDAVQVRMKMQVLTPGVQHGKEADGGTEMPGVG